MVILALVVLGAFAVGYKADYSSFSKAPKATQSATGYNELTSAFPAGVLSPTTVYIESTTKLTLPELSRCQLNLSPPKAYHLSHQP